MYKKDSTLERTEEFNAPTQVLDIPNEIKVDYSTDWVRTKRLYSMPQFSLSVEDGKGNWRY